MFFQEITPDTSGYMIAGYTVAFTVIGLYLLSLYLRNRNLKRDLETLESLQPEKPKTKPRKKK
jgi:CcmD family protein